MLDYCRENVKMDGLTNVTIKPLDWDQVVPGENLERHDVVIASRTTALRDLAKLNQCARKMAVLMAWANAPSIPVILNELFAGTRDDRLPPPFNQDRRLGYNVFYNLAYDQGFDPNIHIVADGFNKDYSDRESAYADLRKLQPFPDDKLEVFKANLDRFLTVNEAGGVTFRKKTRSFVLWWEALNTQ